MRSLLIADVRDVAAAHIAAAKAEPGGRYIVSTEATHGIVPIIWNLPWRHIHVTAEQATSH